MSEKLEVNSIVEGKVLRIKPFGAIVQLPDKSQGLVHISHISSKYVQNIDEFIAIGDTVNVKVLSIDPENGKISLSIKETEQQPAPTEYKKPYDSTQNFRNDSSFAQSGPPSFEDKFKDWLKVSNDRQAGLNKRNKRR